MIPISPPFVDQQRCRRRKIEPKAGRASRRWRLDSTTRARQGRGASSNERRGGARACTARAGSCRQRLPVASVADAAAVAPAAGRAVTGPLLEIRDIALRFGGIVALDGVSFTI